MMSGIILPLGLAAQPERRHFISLCPHLRFSVCAYACTIITVFFFLGAPVGVAKQPFIMVDGQLSAPNRVVFQLKDAPDRGALNHVTEMDAARLQQRLRLPRDAHIRENNFARWQRAHKGNGHPSSSTQVNLNTYLILELGAGLSVPEMLKRLRAHPWTKFAEPDGVGFGGGVPSDPSFDLQWHHVTIGSTNAWTITTGSSNVIVAILDTGINTNEAEFAGRLVPGYNFVSNNDNPSDDHGHGTAVTGVLAANANNDRLVAGVDWSCRIMPVKVLNDENWGYYSWWADGVNIAAANGAKVINLSAGGSGSLTALTDAIRNAVSNGVIFVTITHNFSEGTITYPGNLAESITVGATDSDDTRSSFSNWGEEIDLVAPGRDIYTVGMNGQLEYWLGTSFSAPQVAGVAALLAALRPAINQEEARTLLTAGAEDQVGDEDDTKGWDQHYGWGRLNAAYTLGLAQTEVQPDLSEGVSLIWQAAGHAADQHPYRILRSEDLLSWTLVSNPTNITYSGAAASWTDKEVEGGTISLDSPLYYRLLITPEIP